MFDDRAEAELINKTVVVNLTVLDQLGGLAQRESYRGRIVRANRTDGIVIQVPSGGLKALPADLRAFVPARPGRYQHDRTGEVFDNPDWLVHWTYHLANTKR